MNLDAERLVKSIRQVLGSVRESIDFDTEFL
jgi:hypothetical protein